MPALIWLFPCLPTIVVSYFISSTTLEFTKAKQYCHEFNSDLASIHSLNDFNQTKQLCATKAGSNAQRPIFDSCWFGLNDINTEGKWEYTDGSMPDFGFNNSKPTAGKFPWSMKNDIPQPDDTQGNQNCAILNRVGDYRFGDKECWHPFFVLCNGNAPIINTTIVYISTSLITSTTAAVTLHKNSETVSNISTVELLIIIGCACLLILIILPLIIYIVKNKCSEDKTILIQNAMTILISIGDYDEHPTNEDELLKNMYFSDLSLEQDIQNMCGLFGEDNLNYQIYPHYQDPSVPKLHWTQDEIITLLKDKSDELEEKIDIYDGLIVVISSHGWKDCICTSDYKMIKKNAIHRIFTYNHPESRNIPRIFIFDCCDGLFEHGKNIKKKGQTNSKIKTNEEKIYTQIGSENQETKLDIQLTDKGKVMTVDDIAPTATGSDEHVIWDHGDRNPDYRLVMINAANPGFQSKFRSDIGSYLLYYFAGKTIDDLSNKKYRYIYEIFDEIQNELENDGKQQTTNTYSNGTRYIKLKENKNDCYRTEEQIELTANI